MARVVGIGGVFLRARDPEALRAWYADVLGLAFDETGSVLIVKHAEGDMAVWNAFDNDTAYFGPGSQAVMINYRVDDLDALVATLESRGIALAKAVEDGPYGRFAWIDDPEGNRLELWQPPEGL